MADFTEVRADIEASLNQGYSIADLKNGDDRELDGYCWCVQNAETAFDNYIADLDEGKTIDKIKAEIAEEIWDDVYRHLICDGVDLVYSIEDGEAYREE